MNFCRNTVAIVLLGSGLALAQTGAQSSSAQSTAAPPSAPSAATNGESNISPETPVITIQGVCNVTPDGATRKTDAGPGCKTEITRAQFEKLVNTVAPNAPASAHRQIATQYVRFLTAANEGVKLGVENDPGFNEQLALMRLQILAQDAEKKIQADASNVTDEQAKTYYDQNPSAFEEVTLTRIFVPKSGSQAAGAADPKTIADDARQKLVNKGDPAEIQKSVFEQLKNTGTPPNTNFGAKRRGTLPPAHEQQIFSLQPGEVSQVIPDSIGYVIYRVDAKQQLAFDQVKEEVKRRLAQQRLRDANEQLMDSSKAEYDSSYFGPEVAPPHLGPPAPANPGSATPHPAGSSPTQPSSPSPKK